MRPEHSVRKPWQVMQATLIALSIRYIQNKFILSIQSRRALGFIYIFFEPLSHIFIWMLLHHALSTDRLTVLPQPLFILMGAIPFMLTRNALRESCTIIKRFKKIFIFRQVRPIDLILSMIMMESMLNSLMYMIFLILFWWVGITWDCYHPEFILLSWFCYIIFLFGLSLTLSIASFFLKFVEVLVSTLMRLVYLFSGIFFTADMLPEEIKPYFYANPLFNFIELQRQSFIHGTLFDNQTSLVFLAKIALFTLLLGMSLYIALRHRIMVEIEQR